ncbi:hypothetical protein APR41_10670 [Salegentibacter salinarum]|uniref:DUF1648 domain-containing protein n=1 Tax=Salegentibacter salinarum TaxID=447422 RepID=A0A2N0TNB4_9FLAO|nr:hypothetical protein [Salegentibacter salinarum]PKD16241.1 hypothetical protein APR41_10670 [Salegentibacter salinarum]SKB67593.1 hypothetical protein SAMN05660903_01969 [Salegentibacter salinarum]
MKTKIIRNIFLFLLAFLGVGALYGGGVLILYPSGEILKMPLSLLEKSPFNDYLIPGIILFSILGLVPCLLIFSLVKKPVSKFLEKFNVFKDLHWAWSYTIYIAFVLIIWIQVQMMFLQKVSWLHTFYIFLAICILIIGISPQMRELYKK